MRGRFAAGLEGGGGGAAEDGPDAGGQLTGGERLHDVVVGAHLEPGDPVHRIEARERDALLPFAPRVGSGSQGSGH